MPNFTVPAAARGLPAVLHTIAEATSLVIFLGGLAGLLVGLR